MLLALIIIGISFGYLFTVGLAWHPLDRAIDECDPRIGTFFASLFWPIALSIVIGMSIGDKGLPKLNLTEKRRQREIDEANHKVRLAEIRAKETEALEKALEQAS